MDYSIESKTKVMTKNEIKKLLYQQKPIAVFVMIRKEVAYYSAKISAELEIVINFAVPVKDMGDADFLPEMQSQYLIRYLME